MKRPNILFLMSDQLAAPVLPIYGGNHIKTPHIDRLAAQGVTFDNMTSTCPVCTPFRSMWLTGCHPQTTGHVVNFMNTRHDEIGWGDVFSHAGYDTGYVGKWHLHRGTFPQIDGPDFVPEGRDRLGFRWWRGYNFHTNYFEGSVNLDDWRFEKWEGYETNALNRYAFEFLDHARDQDKPFCLMISPHQPHGTQGKFAPEAYLERLPDDLPLPPNWQDGDIDFDMNAYRLYLAMVLALDDMVGELIDGLEERGLTESTLLVFSTDHGTNLGAHGCEFWGKKLPWEENVRVPMIVRWPGVFDGGKRCDVLTSPVDLLPTCCGFSDIPVPRSVEGRDLSAAWKGDPEGVTQDAVLMMNFTAGYDHVVDGKEWRGVRTQTHTYARFLNGKELLFDNVNDPQQRNNLAGSEEHVDLKSKLERRLKELMELRGDRLMPGSSYCRWFDGQRRVVANAYGPLGDPEQSPDWSLLGPVS